MPQQASITGESEEFSLYFSKGNSFQVLVIFFKADLSLNYKIRAKIEELGPHRASAES